MRVASGCFRNSRRNSDFFEKDTQSVLEGAAGYQEFLIGAPCYLVILSEAAEHAGENAGYMGEDLVLKLSDMGLDSCWLTFTDEAKVREALGLDTPLQVARGSGDLVTAKKMSPKDPPEYPEHVQC